MKTLTPKLLCLMLLPALLAGCRKHEAAKADEEAPSCSDMYYDTDNAVYHWKTTFSPDSFDLYFLSRHNVRTIYMRMFDIATETDPLTGYSQVVPIATTRFLKPVPEHTNVIPTTYITTNALREMRGKEEEFARLIVERLTAMHAYNSCGLLREIQFDCDWTPITRASYATLCRHARELLDQKEVRLSITLRLHQLDEEAPPADRAVLMLYNTGNLKEKDTSNSILDVDDVTPYLKQCGKYALPLSYAYPLFGWGVMFRDGKFVSIVAEDSAGTSADEHIRTERATAKEIMEVKSLVEKHLGKAQGRTVLYHLDQSQLKHYTDEEVQSIYYD